MKSKDNYTYKPDLLYPELSYQIVGILFDVFTNMGYGYNEDHYQKAICVALDSAKIGYERESPAKIFYRDKQIGTNYLDFLIENKIVLEIKQGNSFGKNDIDQVYRYLKATNLKLGLLARFTKLGVRYKRIVNIV